MKIDGIEIGGQSQSVSGYATAITLPEMNVCFDMGTATTEAASCQNVMITHGHLDHFNDVARHAYIRNMCGAPRSRFFVPPFLVDSVHDMMSFWARIQKAKKVEYEVIPVAHGNRVQIEHNRYVVPFRTVHRIASQGYAILEERERVKPEYVGLEGREYARLRKEGVTFSQKVDVPLVTFTGDTQARVLNNDNEALALALQSKVFIMECTFLDDQTVEFAQSRGHTHISEIADRRDRIKGELVLAHFSKRYTNRDVETSISKHFPHNGRIHYLSPFGNGE